MELYLPGLRAFLCLAAGRLHAEQRHGQEVNVLDFDQPKAPRFQGLCQVAFIINVTSDDWEGVPPLESLEQDGCPLGPQVCC